MAIELVDIDAELPFAYLTVNISYPLSNNDDVSLAFIDTKNNEWAEEFIKSNGLGEPTGHIGYSGYCSYPEYRMNLGKINKEEELFNGK